MVRSKVKLEFIKDDSARRATYRKRTKGVLKKVNELSTLCDVQSCAVVYGPYSPVPEVWPSPEGAREVLTRFRRMPEYQQGVKMTNQESFTKGRIKKTEEKLSKMQMENRHKDLTRLMFKGMRGEATSNQNVLDLMDIMSVTDEKIKEIALGIEKLKRGGQCAGSENAKGKEKVVGDDLVQGEETPNRTGEGKHAQGVQVETSNVIIKDTTRLPQHVEMSAPMDQEKLQRIMAIARGKSIGENLPLGTNMDVGTTREREIGSNVNIAPAMPSNPAPAPNYQARTDDLMSYPYQGFSWEDTLMPYPYTYNWSSSSLNPNNDKP